MSRLGFLGSAGLSALIHACRQLESVGHRVILLDPPPTVVQLLDACGLTQQFSLQNT